MRDQRRRRNPDGFKVEVLLGSAVFVDDRSSHVVAWVGKPGDTALVRYNTCDAVDIVIGDTVLRVQALPAVEE